MKSLLLLVASLLMFEVQAQMATTFRDDVSKHSTEAKKLNPKFYLFEVDGVLFIQNGKLAPQVYNSKFAMVENLLTYTSISSVSNEDQPYYAQEIHFVPGHCGGPGCQPPPNKPEPLSAHPTLSQWRVEVPQLEEILKSASFDFKDGTTVTITTAARLKHLQFLNNSAAGSLTQIIKDFARVAPQTPIFRIVNRYYPVHGYIFIDGNTGKIISQGTYRELPPRPGTVSSGG